MIRARIQDARACRRRTPSSRFSSVVISFIGSLLQQIHCHPDGVGETKGIRAAVALDHDAVQAEEHGAVVAARVEPLPKQLERRLANT